MLQEYKVGSILCWAVKLQNHSEKLFTTVSSTAETFFNGVRWGSWKISGWHTLIIRRLLAYITWSKSHLMRESTCRVSHRLILLIFTLSTSEHGLAHWCKNGMTLHFRNPLLFGVWLAVICKPKQDQDMTGLDYKTEAKTKPNKIQYEIF